MIATARIRTVDYRSGRGIIQMACNWIVSGSLDYTVHTDPERERENSVASDDDDEEPFCAANKPLRRIILTFRLREAREGTVFIRSTRIAFNQINDGDSAVVVDVVLAFGFDRAVERERGRTTGTGTRAVSRSNYSTKELKSTVGNTDSSMLSVCLDDSSLSHDEHQLMNRTSANLDLDDRPLFILDMINR